MSSQKGFINILQEYSIPLIAGVLVAVVYANVDEHEHHEFTHIGPFDALCSGAEETHVLHRPASRRSWRRPPRGGR